MPTLPFFDCQAVCQVRDNVTSVPIATGNGVAALKLPTRFLLTFEVKVFTLGEVEELNFLDIVESSSQASLLKIAVKPDLTLSVRFWDAPYATVTAPLTSLTTFTTVVVAYNQNKLAIWTNALVGTAPVANVSSAEWDVSGLTFYLYASTPVDASAGGVIRNIIIHGTLHIFGSNTFFVDLLLTDILSQFLHRGNSLTHSLPDAEPNLAAERGPHCASQFDADTDADLRANGATVRNSNCASHSGTVRLPVGKAHRRPDGVSYTVSLIRPDHSAHRAAYCGADAAALSWTKCLPDRASVNIADCPAHTVAKRSSDRWPHPGSDRTSHSVTNPHPQQCTDGASIRVADCSAHKASQRRSDVCTNSRPECRSHGAAICVTK
jgi:hypothetical protein